MPSTDASHWTCARVRIACLTSDNEPPCATPRLCWFSRAQRLQGGAQVFGQVINSEAVPTSQASNERVHDAHNVLPQGEMVTDVRSPTPVISNGRRSCRLH
jgi:hypothetical protein